MTCATCRHFTTRNHPEQAAIGWGHCTGFIPAAMDFVKWDRPICRLYKVGEQMAAREKWIEKMEKK